MMNRVAYLHDRHCSKYYFGSIGITMLTRMNQTDATQREWTPLAFDQLQLELIDAESRLPAAIVVADILRDEVKWLQRPSYVCLAGRRFAQEVHAHRD
jgi:hypothetical protein